MKLKKQTYKKIPEDGFTIIELLIATLIFSVILLITTFAVIQISRTYIRGYISSETQNTNRGILDELSQAIQLSSDGSIIIPTTKTNPTYGKNEIYWFCVNGQRYTYQYDQELTSSSNDVFVQDKDPGGCMGPGPLVNPPSGDKELLSKEMQLIPPANGGALITAISSNDGEGLYGLNLTILYGDPAAYLVSPTNVKYCAPISVGGAFCGVSTISTTVEERTAAL
jgi:prepilin-type N-terminal cleavage/methylation domain-containing protein